MSSVERYRQRRRKVSTGGSCSASLSTVFDATAKNMSSIGITSNVAVNYYEELAAHYQASGAATSMSANEAVVAIRNKFDEQRREMLVEDIKKAMCKNIANAFGVGTLVSKFDKDGGNVDTINNVREGCYATDAERDKYRSLNDYTPDPYHQDEAYKEFRAKQSKERKSGKLVDAYTGKHSARNAKTDLDHVISAKEIHDDPGRVLADADPVKLANMPSNLASTASSINRSKKALSADDFINYNNERSAERKARIMTLQAIPNRTNSEENELKKLAVFDQLDPTLMNKKDSDARDTYNEVVNDQYYNSNKFRMNLAKTSIQEAGKMGIQQALGMALQEFLSAVIDEIVSIYRYGFSKGFENSGLLKNIKTRLHRIADRVVSNWRNIGDAFIGGAISGLVSNLVTVVINIFTRTGKRIVRVIREGAFSLISAVKFLCFPPEGMTAVQAAHEASKLVFSGLMISGGILLEQQLEVLISSIPILAPVAGLLTTVLIGSITGIVTTVGVYHIDQFDVMGVINSERIRFVRKELCAQTSVAREQAHNIVNNMTTFDHYFE